MLPIWGILALMFAVSVVYRDVLGCKRTVRLAKEKNIFPLSGFLGSVSISNLTLPMLRDLRKKLHGSKAECFYVSGNWLDGYNVVVYYNAEAQWQQGFGIVNNWRGADIVWNESHYDK
jgi:hypothetical protein